MKLFVLFALVAAVSAHSSSCRPREVSNVEPIPPPSVTRITSVASEDDPSISSDISVIEAISLSSPTFATVETVIESYARSHYDTISLLEYYDESPSAITSPTSVADIKSRFPSLASAVSALISEEATHSSLYAIQSSLQAVMAQVSSVLTAGETSFEFSHASLITAETGISAAAITSPSVVTDVEVITAMETLSPSIATYIDDITQAAYHYASVLREITTARDWTYTNAWKIDSTLRSIETCYPTLYTAFTEIDDFIQTHSSDDSAFSHLIAVLSTSPSIISDVTSFVDAVSSSLTEAIAAVSPIQQVDSHITTEVTYLDVLEASNPSLSCAENTIAREMVSNANTIDEIQQALSWPSSCTDMTTVISLEHLYPSILTAVEAITSVEVDHPSLAYIQSTIESAEVIDSAVLTQANEMISATSPSLVGDASDMEKIESVSPTITVALHSLSTIIEASPSLSCAESVIAHYASSHPTVLYTLEVALNSPSSVSPSEIPYITELTGKYPSLASAVRTIISAETTFPQLSTIQSDITFALTYEPSLISVYHQITEYETIVTNEVCSFVPSYSR